MFDDVFEMTEHCAEMFRDGVRDEFGACIIADLLDPIRNHIGQLRSLREDVQRQSLNVEHLLEDARSMTLSGGSQG